MFERANTGKRYHVGTDVDSALKCLEYLSSGGSSEWFNVRKMSASGFILLLAETGIKRFTVQKYYI